MTKELINYGEEVKALEAITDYAAKTKWFESLGGKPGMMMIALYAREMGLPVAQCLFGGMKSILGKIEIAPVMMNSMIRKAGHKMITIKHTDDECVLKGIRSDTGEEMVVSFSISDAKRAKIYKSGGAWETYPKNMTYKSCVQNLGKWLFADVFGPSYGEGEIDVDSQSFNKKPMELLIADVKEIEIGEVKNTINMNKETGEITPEEPRYISEAQLKKFYAMTHDYPKYIEMIKKKYGDAKHMPADSFNDFIAHFNEWSKNNEPQKKIEPIPVEAKVEDFSYAEMPF